jgi:transcriptional regulator with XRE-family HTH domain
MHKAINEKTLRAALAERGWTQSLLAKDLGVSSQSITNWMKGADFPRPATLLRLATTLRLTFDELVKIEDEGKPIVAFRKKAGAKTTAQHISKAMGIGMLLKPLVPYLPQVQALRTVITSPSTDYPKLQAAALQTRSRLGIGDQAVLSYEHLIGEFKNCGAVLVPVLWGAKGNHENALHIRLPQEDVTFVFLNLDTRLEDFKFWMAHELAHVFTPELAGKEEGEDFADAFAGALLFPKACAEQACREIAHARSTDAVLKVFCRWSQEHMISLNTVYQQVKRFANDSGLPLPGIDERAIHATRNVISGPLISAVLFDPAPPDANLYIAAAEHAFQSDFFIALRQMVKDQGTGPSYVQQILESPMQDAFAMHRVLSH